MVTGVRISCGLDADVAGRLVGEEGDELFGELAEHRGGGVLVAQDRELVGDERMIRDVQAHTPRLWHRSPREAGPTLGPWRSAASERDDALMVRALALAERRRAAGDVPVGAVVADAAGTGDRRGAQPPRSRRTTRPRTPRWSRCAQAAASLGSWNLDGCTLVVTLEPCLMCAGALLQAHVSRLVFGAWDDKAGAAGSLYDVVRDRRLPYRAEVVGGCARRTRRRAAAASSSSATVAAPASAGSVDRTDDDLFGGRVRGVARGL